MEQQGKTKSLTETKLMTDGVIWKQMLFFAFPLILGNLFQQLYNTVDSAVVGNFIGGTALAAVGAGSTVIMLLLGLFLGLSVGASVYISQCFGEGNQKKLQETVHTAAAFTLIFGVVLSIIGVLMAEPILRWMHTPDNVFVEGARYLKIFFAGIVFAMIYNVGAAILRAVGDSKTPLYYMGVACTINIVLDIFFVVVLHMGVEGVAYATLIAQAVAAALVVRKLVRTDDIYHLEPKKIRIHGIRLKHILMIGIPSGLQQVTISLSNVVIQGYVNGFGSNVMAGWSAFSKLDSILILPIMSFGMAMTTFTGQNVGARKPDRVYKGVWTCMAMSCGLAVISAIPVYIFGGELIGIFTHESGIIEAGLYMLRGMVPFYFILATIQVFSGTISGSGHSLASMVIMVINMCVIRILMLMFMASRMDDMIFICYAYILSWTTCALTFYVYYRKGGWRKELQDGPQL